MKIIDFLLLIKLQISEFLLERKILYANFLPLGNNHSVNENNQYHWCVDLKCGTSNTIFSTKYKAMSVQVRNLLTLGLYILFSVNQVITCQFINITENGLKLLTEALCEFYHFIDLSQQKQVCHFKSQFWIRICGIK